MVFHGLGSVVEVELKLDMPPNICRKCSLETRHDITLQLLYQIGTYHSITCSTRSRCQFPVVFNKNLAEYQTNKPKLDENLDLLETFLGRSENAAGEKVTIADLALLANVSTVQAAGLLDKDKWPRISAWLTRLQTSLPYYSVNVEGCNMLGEALKKGMAEIGA